LIAEFGGACQICGYDRFPGALQFHHRDPQSKAFGIALDGAARSLAGAREEAAKCVLLCANCHAEVEWGGATLPPVDPPRGVDDGE
jgi:5-methylcytosine-specific restriction endonuclease McrA